MVATLKVLVVDDDPSTCLFLKSAFASLGHDCVAFDNANNGRAYVREHGVDLVMLDVYLGDTVGIDLVPAVRAQHPDCYCVIMTAHVSVETAAQSVSEGALEYVAKPLLLGDLEAIATRVAERRKRSHRPVLPIADNWAPETAIVGASPRMLDVYRAIARVAPSNAHVLITGPSGTGKELVARAIHDHSPRKDKPFTAVNCGSLTETILESELFGHEKGSFTGADSLRKGLVEAANGGTLFLDEITETTLSFQVKLLRFIQEQQVRRIGSNKFTPVDVRILASSNRNLQTQIAKGLFREDLFYRLSVVQIAMPALAERVSDIPQLIAHFLTQFNLKNGLQVAIELEAVERLRALEWPGNVRELENCVLRLAIFSSSGMITVADVERFTESRSVPKTVEEETMSGIHPVIPQRLSDHERELIKKVLNEVNGNRSEAARRLGIQRKTLYMKAQRLGISLVAAGKGNDNE